MAPARIPNLVFSTRSPEPKSGSDFVREVVAESPGVSEAARRELARRADLAGSLLHHRLEPDRRALAFSFSPLTGSTWLFARAVSLGLYRKGSHHLLVHGAVLGREELEALEGNPLLLERQEVQAESGFAFAGGHPGSAAAARRLDPLRFDHRVAPLCRRLNRQHLEALADPAWEPWLPAAYDALAAGERLACALPAPEPGLVEWLLLHLHPDDRPEVSFHTFYSYDRAVDVRLLLLVPEDVPQVQGQLRPLRLLELEAPPLPPEGRLGALAARLRRRSAAAFLDTLAGVQLTHLSRHHRPPLAPADAHLALRAGLHDLGLEPPLDPDEEERHRVLLQRGKRDLRFHVDHLAGEWRRRPRRLEEALARLAATQERITGEEVERFLAGRLPAGLAEWEQRWALAALLAHQPALEPDDGWEERRRSAWARLVPPGRFGELLASFDEEQAREAEPLLLAYTLAVVGDGQTGAPPYWRILLDWLAGRGRDWAPALEAVEKAISVLEPPAARAGLRDLGELCRRLGRPAAALRLLLERELPLLGQAAARPRLRTATASALDAGGPEQDRLLAAHLRHPWVAAEVLAGLAAWLESSPAGAAAAAWERTAALLGDAAALAPDSAAACGALLAALAASPASGKVAAALDLAGDKLPDEADAGAFAAAALAAAAEPLARRCEEAASDEELARLVAAAAALLDAHCGLPGAGDADPALMRLGVRGKVLAAEAGARGTGGEAVRRLAGTWPAFLRTVLAAGRFDRPTDGRDDPEWLGLLADELAASPPQSAEDDPRYEAFLRLAWTAWSREAAAGEPGTAGVKILQALAWGRDSTTRAWHRRLIESVVGEEQLQAAWRPVAARLEARTPPPAGGSR